LKTPAPRVNLYRCFTAAQVFLALSNAPAYKACMSRATYSDGPSVPPSPKRSHFVPGLPSELAERLIAWLVLGFWTVVLLILIWTSFYTVPADSVAIVQRFGRYMRTDDPGLRFKIPFGMESVTLVPVRRQLKLEFGFATSGASNPFQASHEPEMEKAMVTGDLNEAVVEWTVQYRVSDPKRFLFDVRDPEETLRAASEAVMREVIGDRTVDEVITIGRQDIEVEAKAVLQKVVGQYQLGVSVDLVQLKNVNPPKQVQASFDEVNQAQQEKQRAINLANGEYNKVVPRAKGDAERLIAEAHGYAQKRVNEAEGDAALFNAVFAQYRKAPEVTRQRIYLETMTEVLPKTGRKIIVDDKGQQVLPLLQLQPEK
jgi:modulator of FtsH protease HflK